MSTGVLAYECKKPENYKAPKLYKIDHDVLSNIEVEKGIDPIEFLEIHSSVQSIDSFAGTGSTGPAQKSNAKHAQNMFQKSRTTRSQKNSDMQRAPSPRFQKFEKKENVGKHRRKHRRVIRVVDGVRVPEVKLASQSFGGTVGNYSSEEDDALDNKIHKIIPPPADFAYRNNHESPKTDKQNENIESVDKNNNMHQENDENDRPSKRPQRKNSKIDASRRRSTGALKMKNVTAKPKVFEKIEVQKVKKIALEPLQRPLTMQTAPGKIKPFSYKSVKSGILGYHVL